MERTTIPTVSSFKMKEANYTAFSMFDKLIHHMLFSHDRVCVSLRGGVHSSPTFTVHLSANSYITQNSPGPQHAALLSVNPIQIK